MRRLLFLALSFFISNVISTTFDSQIDPLSGTTVDCAATTKCSIYCRDEGSCDSLTINATLADNLNVECELSGSCFTMTIYANNLIINCNDVESCLMGEEESEHFVTVANTNPSGNFMLNCNGEMSCEGLNLFAANYFSRYIYSTLLIATCIAPSCFAIT